MDVDSLMAQLASGRSRLSAKGKQRRLRSRLRGQDAPGMEARMTTKAVAKTSGPAVYFR
jgi:hypothetical protein